MIARSSGTKAGPLSFARSLHALLQRIAVDPNDAMAVAQVDMIRRRCPDVDSRCHRCGHLTLTGDPGRHCARKAK